MSGRRDEALTIFCALLARDPLPAQRFTDINTRLAQLASLAIVAADTFHVAHGEHDDNATEFRAKTAELWNRHSAAEITAPLPKALRDKAQRDGRPPAEHDLITQMTAANGAR